MVVVVVALSVSDTVISIFEPSSRLKILNVKRDCSPSIELSPRLIRFQRSLERLILLKYCSCSIDTSSKFHFNLHETRMHIRIYMFLLTQEEFFSLPTYREIFRIEVKRIREFEKQFIEQKPIQSGTMDRSYQRIAFNDCALDFAISRFHGFTVSQFSRSFHDLSRLSISSGIKGLD